MAITAGMVKELREMTGAGMMDCKKALAATEGGCPLAVGADRCARKAARLKKSLPIQIDEQRPICPAVRQMGAFCCPDGLF